MMRLTRLCLVLVASAACSEPPNRFADVVFQGGTILTMDSVAPRAEAVALKAGRIVYVGADTGVERWIGSRTQVIRLDGKTLMPSFQDAHMHPVTTGLDLMACDLTGRGTRNAIVERIRACADSLPAGAWLVGSNWELPIFPAANPRRELLDSLAPGRPAWFTASDGHSGWANSEALGLKNNLSNACVCGERPGSFEEAKVQARKPSTCAVSATTNPVASSACSTRARG